MTHKEFFNSEERQKDFYKKLWIPDEMPELPTPKDWKKYSKDSDVETSWLYQRVNSDLLFIITDHYGIDIELILDTGRSLWHWSSPQEHWDNLFGRSGLCICNENGDIECLNLISLN